MEKELLELFKVMVVKDDEPLRINVDFAVNGLVLDFVPTREQKRVLLDFYKPLDIITLFSREERETASPETLIMKQILHYIEVYGLNTPGLFDLETNSGQIFTVNYVRGVSLEVLGCMVRDLIYTNAPIKDVVALSNIIKGYNIDYDINKVLNNELRVVMFDIEKDTFTNGDDAVRYMCYCATGDTMLIKTRQMETHIKTIFKENNQKFLGFLEKHETQLANVFNRHKRLIIAAKNPLNKTVINRISRLSKTLHIPLKESINKVYISKALRSEIDQSVLDKIDIRDKLKYLNLLSYKKEQLDLDAFLIRNGKLHFETKRPIWDNFSILRVEENVLSSIKRDLNFLNKRNILLDGKVHYGFPVSRKQVVGQLPFGTRVSLEDSSGISSGIYWKNSWGAFDLDLSTIDTHGNRIGWGSCNSYSNSSIVFSGDMTNAFDGAMEFMTSKNTDYGLFVNIYNGNVGCAMEVVVGSDKNNKTNWIESPVIREKTQLNSRGMIIGFVKGKTFIVYLGRLSQSRVSSNGKNPMVTKGLSYKWTINNLFDKLGICYDTERSDIKYDHDLNYSNFSYDKLEKLFL